MMKIETDSPAIAKMNIMHMPADDPAGCIIMVHGLGEHIERYQGLAGYFNSRHYSFIGADLPGHGKSPGVRGFIKNIEQCHRIINDLSLIVRETEGNVPLFLYGHSLGGALALNYLQSNEVFAKAIITSPWISLAEEPPAFRVKLAFALSRLVPSLQQESGLDPAYISSDKNVVAEYISDPLVHSKITLSLFRLASKNAIKLKAAKDILNIPVLLMHGVADRITSPGGSEMFAENNTGVELKLWQDGYHELHNEPFKNDVLDFIVNWLKK